MASRLKDMAGITVAIARAGETSSKIVLTRKRPTGQSASASGSTSRGLMPRFVARNADIEPRRHVAQGFVFAEVSNNYDGWVYLMVQDKRTGRVFTIEDNRTTLLEQKKMRSDAERSALSNLLGGPSFDASRK